MGPANTPAGLGRHHHKDAGKSANRCREAQWPDPFAEEEHGDGNDP